MVLHRRTGPSQVRVQRRQRSASPARDGDVRMLHVITTNLVHANQVQINVKRACIAMPMKLSKDVLNSTTSAIRLGHVHLIRTPGVGVPVCDVAHTHICSEGSQSTASRPFAVNVLEIGRAHV